VEVKLNKKLIKKIKKIKVEESCFLYGKNKLEKIYYCKSKNDGKIYTVSKLNLIMFFFKFIFSGSDTVCFCHRHGNWHNLSFTDYLNMVDEVFYMVVYENKFYLYKKNGVLKSLEEIGVKII